MLGAVGDLVEDVVVRFATAGPTLERASDLALNLGTDTPVRVERRQGGSAANVCVAVAALGRPARFIGQLGADATGLRLSDDLAAAGVEPVGHRGGRTGTVIALCHADGERSMLTDRGASRDLSGPEPAWLDGLSRLHVPLYSLAGGALAVTTATLAEWARERGLAVSLDLSSAALLAELGPDGLRMALVRLQPGVVLANADEAARAGLGAPDAAPAAITVVKQGPGPALVRAPGRAETAVPAPDLGPVPDTTGAGDAFAAGFLTALGDGADPVEAARAGHRSAADRLLRQAAEPEPERGPEPEPGA